MADIVVRATEPALAAIKLAWWRDQLEGLDRGEVPAEPRLHAAADQLLPRGMTGSELGELEDCWALILRSDDQDQFMKGLARRGPLLFGFAARLLGVPVDEAILNAGRAFVTVDLARRGMTTMQGQTLRQSRVDTPARARSLTAFGALAYRDMIRGGPPFEAEATPARAWVLIRHRLSGRMPHG